MNEFWSSLFLSTEIAIVATIITGLFAIPLAFVMARSRFPGRSLLESLIMVPLVLPPTVVGYFILVGFGRQGLVGRWLGEAFDYSIVFRFEGAVLAASFVAVPMLYMPAKAAFQNVNRELEDVARSMGAGKLQTFWRISLPLARRGVLSGLVLAFARAIGEFGATVMVFGWQQGRLTLPISIYADYERGKMAAALPAVLGLGILSLLLILAYNRLVRATPQD